jgi:hypothetical protein
VHLLCSAAAGGLQSSKEQAIGFYAFLADFGPQLSEDHCKQP